MPRQGFEAILEVKVDHLDADLTTRKILDFFQSLDLWNSMVRETNRYVQQRSVTPSSHMKAWENTTAEELQSFMDFCLFVGTQP